MKNEEGLKGLAAEILKAGEQKFTGHLEFDLTMCKGGISRVNVNIKKELMPLNKNREIRLDN